MEDFPQFCVVYSAVLMQPLQILAFLLQISPGIFNTEFQRQFRVQNFLTGDCIGPFPFRFFNRQILFFGFTFRFMPLDSNPTYPVMNHFPSAALARLFRSPFFVFALLDRTSFPFKTVRRSCQFSHKNHCLFSLEEAKPFSHCCKNKA